MLLLLGIIVFPNAKASATSHSASITTSGSKSINVAPSSDGAGTSISADDITVTTTCRSGYNLTLSTSVNDNNLYLNGDVANNTSGTYFAPASGSTSLSESPNTWGYFMSADAPTASSTFSAVPTPSSPTTIKTPLATPSDTDISDEFSVYYGVAVSSSVTPGTYKMIPDTNNSNNDGTIVYRLTMADVCITYSVAFSPTSTFEGNQLTGTGTVSSQTIYEGVATNLTSAKFTAPSGYYFAGWNTEPDGTGTAYSSGQSVTDLASVGETLTLYAMWTDCPANKICYDKVISPAVGTMGQQSATSNTKITLLASNYSSGDPTNTSAPGDYGFAGWSTIKLNPDSTDFRTDLADAVSAGKVYGPQEDVTPGDLSSGGLKLYAIWMPVAKDDNDTELTFQTTNLLTTTLADTDDGTTLSAKPNGYVTALRDQRDNQVYAVAKLADGKYWMIENLRLENTAEHNSDGTLAQGYGTSATYGNFSGLADPESANFTSSTTANSLYYSGTQDGTASIDIGTSNWPAYRMPHYNNLNTTNRASNPTSNTFAQDNTTGGMYSYGNYYTWHAAIADTTYYSYGDHGATSLCPTGWRLPQGSTTTSGFGKLDVDMGGTGEYQTTTEASLRWRKYPVNFLYSGDFSTSSAGYRGSYGSYWSSTVSSGLNSYDLELGSSLVHPGTLYNAMNDGFSVRCMVSAGT